MSTSSDKILYGTASGALGDVHTYVTNNNSEVVAPHTLATAIELEDGSDLEATIKGVVKAIPQTLTPAQREYILNNIGAIAIFEPKEIDPSNNKPILKYTSEQQTQARKNMGAVHIGGDTMTGPLTLAADPTESLHAVTKQYADGLAMKSGGGNMLMEIYDKNELKLDIFDTIAAVKALIDGENGVNTEITSLKTKIAELEATVADLADSLSGYVTLETYNAGVGNLRSQITAANDTFNSHTTRSDNPHSVNQKQVGLEFVENKRLIMNVSDDGKTLSTTYKAQ